MGLYQRRHGQSRGCSHTKNPTTNLLTPLHWAATQGHVAMYRWLVDRGAQPRALCARGETPVGLAIRNRHSDVVSELAVDKCI